MWTTLWVTLANILDVKSSKLFDDFFFLMNHSIRAPFFPQTTTTSFHTFSLHSFLKLHVLDPKNRIERKKQDSFLFTVKSGASKRTGSSTMISARELFGNQGIGFPPQVMRTRKSGDDRPLWFMNLFHIPFHVSCFLSGIMILLNNWIVFSYL